MARAALMRSAFGEAASQVIKGTAEMLGLKEKTGAAEMEEKAQPKPLALSKHKQNSK